MCRANLFYKAEQMYNKTAKPARNAKENERICHQNTIKIPLRS